MSERAQAPTDRRAGVVDARPTPDAVPALVAETLAAPGRPLDSSLRESLGARLGHDFSRVRIHADGAAARSADALNAAAYAAGPHLVFGSGRYEPRTRRGQRLLLHELGHSLHQQSAGSHRPGLAPPDALAEHRAERFAGRALAGEPQLGSPVASFADWGPAWQLHAQEVKTAGTQELRDDQVGLLPGQMGPPVGGAEVRTGVEVPWTDPTGKKEISPNAISIRYAGGAAAGSHWLQFGWVEVLAVKPGGKEPIEGQVPSLSGTVPTTINSANPAWFLDAGRRGPFYEDSALNRRDASSTAIFDEPRGWAGIASTVFATKPGTTAVEVTASFATYLIQNGLAIYCVKWSAGMVFASPPPPTPGRWRVEPRLAYRVAAVGSGSGTVKGLPSEMKKVLLKRFPTVTGIE